MITLTIKIEEHGVEASVDIHTTQQNETEAEVELAVLVREAGSKAAMERLRDPWVVEGAAADAIADITKH